MKKNRNAMTLLEILIVITVFAVLAVSVIILMDPAKMYGRALDTTKKTDLAKFKKAMEEYFNDKGCYPSPNMVCYTGGDNATPPGNPCYICGDEATSPQLKPYLETLPCDPSHPKQKFYYSVDTYTCPKMYRIYAKFNIQNDESSLDVGCAQSGCGPSLPWGYDYGEASPNIWLNRSGVYNCYTRDAKCNNCGGPGNLGTDAYTNCLKSVETGACLTIYSSHEACCADNPDVGCT